MSGIWKKAIVCGVSALFVVLLTGGAVFAADVIGVIDSQQIISRHPNFEATIRQVQQIMRQKENEARLAIDAEPNEARRAQIMQTKLMEARREEQRLMEPIFNACQEAVRIVARQRNVTVVLERSAVYFGGVDITDLVILQLNR